MKRMYVVLACMFAFILWAGALLGQGSRPVDDASDAFEKRMRMRGEMHRRMIDKLFHGVGPDQDMFSDMEKMMDDAMKDSFSSFEMFDGRESTSSHYRSEWKESVSGRTLEITPSKPDQQLDINVANGMITIKGKAEKKTGHSSFISNFSNAFSVPGDCDPSKVKIDQKDGKILVFFPYAKTSRPVEVRPKEDRKPLPPSDSDVQI
jgi:HSP20 family molecular chaperone IbpA